jgi:hypothetical protein
MYLCLIYCFILLLSPFSWALNLLNLYIFIKSITLIVIIKNKIELTKMEVQGKIKLIGETQSIGSNGFRKRELVVTTDEQYPQHVLVEFVQDKTDLLNNFQVGQQIKVGINLRGREWINPQGEAKYFNAIQGWRIENLQQAQAPANAAPVAPAQAFEPATDLTADEPNDLPF